MPVHLNSIDGLPFVDMQGNIEPRGEQLELFMRPGYNGHIARKTGVRGTPFRVRTVNYVSTLAYCKTVLEEFKLLIGVDPVEVYQYSVYRGTFLVLNVRQVEVKAMVNCTLGNYQARLVCDWELLG